MSKSPMRINTLRKKKEADSLSPETEEYSIFSPPTPQDTVTQLLLQSLEDPSEDDGKDQDAFQKTTKYLVFGDPTRHPDDKVIDLVINSLDSKLYTINTGPLTTREIRAIQSLLGTGPERLTLLRNLNGTKAGAPDNLIQIDPNDLKDIERGDASVLPRLLMGADGLPLLQRPIVICPHAGTIVIGGNLEEITNMLKDDVWEGLAGDNQQLQQGSIPIKVSQPKLPITETEPVSSSEVLKTEASEESENGSRKGSETSIAQDRYVLYVDPNDKASASMIDIVKCLVPSSQYRIVSGPLTEREINTLQYMLDPLDRVKLCHRYKTELTEDERAKISRDDTKVLNKKLSGEEVPAANNAPPTTKYLLYHDPQDEQSVAMCELVASYIPASHYKVIDGPLDKREIKSLQNYLEAGERIKLCKHPELISAKDLQRIKKDKLDILENMLAGPDGLKELVRPIMVCPIEVLVLLDSLGAVVIGADHDKILKLIMNDGWHSNSDKTVNVQPAQTSTIRALIELKKNMNSRQSDIGLEAMPEHAPAVTTTKRTSIGSAMLGSLSASFNMGRKSARGSVPDSPGAGSIKPPSVASFQQTSTLTTKSKTKYTVFHDPTSHTSELMLNLLYERAPDSEVTVITTQLTAKDIKPLLYLLEPKEYLNLLSRHSLLTADDIAKIKSGQKSELLINLLVLQYLETHAQTAECRIVSRLLTAAEIKRVEDGDISVLAAKLSGQEGAAFLARPVLCCPLTGNCIIGAKMDEIADLFKDGGADW
eukprot:jgi/Hompol1/885/HPOL_004019-RA